MGTWVSALGVLVRVFMPPCGTLRWQSQQAMPSSLGLHIVNAAGLDKLGVELFVTAYAVVHDHLGTGILGHDGLPLGVGHEVGHMLHAVHALEGIVTDDVAVGYVTVVARGVTAMARMAPRGIIRTHDVAVDAGQWGRHLQR